jgi:chemotaxis protein methyltransferase CheR
MTLSEAQLTELDAAIASQLGLHFPPDRHRELERGIQRAAREFGFDNADACARWLAQTPLNRKQIEILAGYLTIGETYFFREKLTFEALRPALSALIDERRGHYEHLRLWSAGCCTGEEPYSIAMWLRENFPELNKWSVSILATDINPQFLRKAVAGVYGLWSFRDTPAELRDRYFRPAGKDQFELSAEIRRMVTFATLNLVDDSYPSIMKGISALDVIFCRNVLMYFTPEQTAKVARRFFDSLVDGGWLLTSPVEASPLLNAQFTALSFPGATCYRKDMPALSFETLKPETSVPTPAPHPATPISAPTSRPQPTPAVEASTNAPGNAGAMAQRAASYANQGQLTEALDWCQQAIAADRLNANPYYLLAMIQQEMGDLTGAEHALRQALYLAPEFVLAHFALGNLAREQGHTTLARKHFANVQSLLSAYPPDEIVPESDGMSASRLLDIARLLA